MIAILGGAPGCGDGDQRGDLEIDARLSLCRDDACETVAASGAQVVVFQDGHRLWSGALDEAGRLSKQVPPGLYTASLAFPSLGLSIPAEDAPPVQISRGGAGSLTVIFPSALEVTPRP
ncbi:MAG: hypothetical protein ACXV3F_16560 [Frankiaceae bacterium]